MHNEKNKIESIDDDLIKKIKFLERRKKQRTVVEVLVFVSIVLNNHYLFAVALLSWFIYLLIGIHYYLKKSILTFFIYLIILMIVAYLLVASISGIIKH